MAILRAITPVDAGTASRCCTGQATKARSVCRMGRWLTSRVSNRRLTCSSALRHRGTRSLTTSPSTTDIPGPDDSAGGSSGYSRAEEEARRVPWCSPVAGRPLEPERAHLATSLLTAQLRSAVRRAAITAAERNRGLCRNQLPHRPVAAEADLGGHRALASRPLGKRTMPSFQTASACGDRTPRGVGGGGVWRSRAGLLEALRGEADRQLGLVPQLVLSGSGTSVRRRATKGDELVQRSISLLYL